MVQWILIDWYCVVVVAQRHALCSVFHSAIRKHNKGKKKKKRVKRGKKGLSTPKFVWSWGLTHLKHRNCLPELLEEIKNSQNLFLTARTRDKAWIYCYTQTSNCSCSPLKIKPSLYTSINITASQTEHRQQAGDCFWLWGQCSSGFCSSREQLTSITMGKFHNIGVSKCTTNLQHKGRNKTGLIHNDNWLTHSAFSEQYSVAA